MAIVQVRDIDDAVVEQLKQRASEAGLSLSAFLRRELGTIAERGALRDRWRDFTAGRHDVPLEVIIDVVREGRQ